MMNRSAILGFIIDLLSLTAINAHAQQKHFLGFNKLKDYVSYQPHSQSMQMLMLLSRLMLPR